MQVRVIIMPKLVFFLVKVRSDKICMRDIYIYLARRSRDSCLALLLILLETSPIVLDCGSKRHQASPIKIKHIK